MTTLTGWSMAGHSDGSWLYTVPITPNDDAEKMAEQAMYTGVTKVIQRHCVRFDETLAAWMRDNHGCVPRNGGLLSWTGGVVAENNQQTPSLMSSSVRSISYTTSTPPVIVGDCKEPNHKIELCISMEHEKGSDILFRVRGAPITLISVPM